jgi:hypothetical protein
MLFIPKKEERLAKLAETLRLYDAPNAESRCGGHCDGLSSRSSASNSTARPPRRRSRLINRALSPGNWVA